MKLQQHIILAKFLADLRNKTHEWGKTDCVTVLFDYHDALWGTNKAKDIKGKYGSKRGAIDLYKNSKLTWRQWMHTNKYRKVEGDFKEGDIAVLDHHNFPSAYIYHNNVFWIMSEDRGFIAVDPVALKDHPSVSFWRHL